MEWSVEYNERECGIVDDVVVMRTQNEGCCCCCITKPDFPVMSLNRVKNRMSFRSVTFETVICCAISPPNLSTVRFLWDEKDPLGARIITIDNGTTTALHRVLTTTSSTPNYPRHFRQANRNINISAPLQNKQPSSQRGIPDHF